jgi:hypothetical protein
MGDKSRRDGAVRVVACRVMRATPATQEKLLAVLAPVMRAEEVAARRPVPAMAN